MNKRRILVGTPLKNGMSGHFLNGLVPMLESDFPGIDLKFVTVGGPSVNFARNELAYIAVKEKYDGLVQIDEDLQWSLPDLFRILTRAQDIVAGVYCVKIPGPTTWLYKPKPGAVVRPDGLLDCDEVAAGFLYTSTSALVRIQSANPEREFIHRERSAEVLDTHMEWFPMGVVGPRSAEERLAAVLKVLSGIPVAQVKGFLPSMAFEAVRNAAISPQPAGSLLGEDYYFCRLAAKAGIPVYADLGCVIPHLGPEPHPITPAMVTTNPIP